MISRALEAEILRLYRTEQWKIGTIATQLRVHHSVVRRVLAQAGVPAALTTARPSMIDPFRPFIHETLTQYPRLPASRLYRMVKERGYPGAEDHFRALIARLRPRPSAEAYLRLRTLPGEQGQVDWAHFGKLQSWSGARMPSGFIRHCSNSPPVSLMCRAVNPFIPEKEWLTERLDISEIERREGSGGMPDGWMEIKSLLNRQGRIVELC